MRVQTGMWVEHPNQEIRAKQNLHVMKIAPSVLWPPGLMWKDIPASISHGVTFFAVLVALTLIFVCMVASNGRVTTPSSAPKIQADNISMSSRKELTKRISITGFKEILCHQCPELAGIDILVRCCEEETAVAIMVPIHLQTMKTLKVSF